MKNKMLTPCYDLAESELESLLGATISQGGHASVWSFFRDTPQMYQNSPAEILAQFSEKAGRNDH